MRSLTFVVLVLYCSSLSHHAVSAEQSTSGSEIVTCTAALVVEDHFTDKNAYGYMLCELNNGTSLIFGSEDPLVSRFETEDELQLRVKQSEQVANTSQSCRTALCHRPQHEILEVLNVRRRARRDDRKARYIDQGARSMIMIRINYRDSKVSYCDEACVRTNAWTGSQNTNGMFQESSYGRISFPEGQVITVEIDQSINSLSNCPFWDMGLAADAAARQQHNIDPDNYVHRAYYIPSNTPGCFFGGVAYIGCSVTHCKSWMRSANGPVLAHELGHNLALQHAGKDDNNDGQKDAGLYGEYGDHSGIMGNSGLWRGVNAPHRITLGFLPSSGILELDGNCDSSLTVTLNSLFHNPSTRSSGYSVVKFSRPRGGDYFISLRTAVGYDVTMSNSFVNRVAINYETSAYLPSMHITGLMNGEVFRDGDISVTVKSLTKDVASLDIDFCGGGGGGAGTPPPPPPPGDCRDSHQSCSQWAALGYCEESSQYHDYMAATCKFSCRLCGMTTAPPTTTTDPSGCIDQNALCTQWKNAGYCLESSVYHKYVWRTCPKTCQKCGSGGSSTTAITTTSNPNCPDLHDSCQAWASAGYCQTSSTFYEYMLRTCKNSCQFCDNGDSTTTLAATTTGPKCINNHNSCEYWADLGFCEDDSTYKNYMHSTCRLACDLCDPGSTSTVKTTTDRGECRDLHLSCSYWNYRGYCLKESRYHAYMFQNCRKSCGFCGVTTTVATTAPSTTRTTTTTKITTTTAPSQIIIRSVSPTPILKSAKTMQVTVFFSTNLVGASLTVSVREEESKTIIGQNKVQIASNMMRGEVILSVSVDLSSTVANELLEIQTSLVNSAGNHVVESNIITVTVNENPKCEDLNGDCGHWAYFGHCTDPTFQEYMRHICKRSCQLCPTDEPIASPPTATTVSPTSFQAEAGSVLKSSLSCNQLGWKLRFGNKESCGESDAKLGGCHKLKDFNFASQICQSAGARLCTPEELVSDVTRGTGCGLDRMLIWTSDDCQTDDGTTGFMAVVGRDPSTIKSPRESQCLATSSTVASVRCCADVKSNEDPQAQALIYDDSKEFEDNYGDVDSGEVEMLAPPQVPDEDIVMPPPPDDLLVPPEPIDDDHMLEEDETQGDKNEGLSATTAATTAVLVVFIVAVAVVLIVYFKYRVFAGSAKSSLPDMMPTHDNSNTKTSIEESENEGEGGTGTGVHGQEVVGIGTTIKDMELTFEEESCPPPPIPPRDRQIPHDYALVNQLSRPPLSSERGTNTQQSKTKSSQVGPDCATPKRYPPGTPVEGILDMCNFSSMSEFELQKNSRLRQKPLHRKNPMFQNY